MYVVEWNRGLNCIAFFILLGSEFLVAEFWRVCIEIWIVMSSLLINSHSVSVCEAFHLFSLLLPLPPLPSLCVLRSYSNTVLPPSYDYIHTCISGWNLHGSTETQKQVHVELQLWGWTAYFSYIVRGCCQLHCTPAVGVHIFHPHTTTDSA